MCPPARTWCGVHGLSLLPAANKSAPALSVTAAQEILLAAATIASTLHKAQVQDSMRSLHGPSLLRTGCLVAAALLVLVSGAAWLCLWLVVPRNAPLS